MKTKICLVVVLLLSALRVHSAEFTNLVIYVGEIFPMCYADADGKPAGIAVDILNETSRRSGIAFEYIVLPWPRAQAIVQQADYNAGIIPLSRTPEREPLYNWVSHIYEQTMVFVTVEDKPPPETIDEARVMRIGTLQANMYAPVLAEMGFEHVELVPSEDQNAEKLQAGRFDAWLVSDLVARSTYDKVIGEAAGLNYGATLGEPLHVYLGGSKVFDPALAKIIDDTVQLMRAEGVIDSILENYR